MERKREERKIDNSHTIKSVYCETVEKFKNVGIEEFDSQVKLLMEHCFGVASIDYVLNPDKELESESYDYYLECVNKRCDRIPLQHIIGKTNFMGMDFSVNENVLIPRFDTENLVEKVLKICEGRNVLDMCTGSGCIILSLAKLGKIKSGIGIDVSEKALEIARHNKEMLSVDNVEFLQSDMFDVLEKNAHDNKAFDIIVSNPPYIPTGEIEKLMREVKNHDPFIALDGKEDGLFFYRRISKEARKYLVESGVLALEIGYDQGESVPQILKADGYKDIKVYKDLSGLDRVVIANI